MEESLKNLLGPMSEETRLLLESAPPAVLVLVGMIAVCGWQLDCAPIKGAARLQFSKDHWQHVAILRWRKLKGIPPCLTCHELPPESAFANSFLPSVVELVSMCGFTIQKLIPPLTPSFEGSLSLLNPDGDLLLLLEVFKGKGR